MTLQLGALSVRYRVAVFRSGRVGGALVSRPARFVPQMLPRLLASSSVRLRRINGGGGNNGTEAVDTGFNADTNHKH